MKLKNKLISKTYFILRNFKFEFIFLNIIFLFSSIFELIGIGLIIPFLMFLFDTDVSATNHIAIFLNSFFKDKTILLTTIFLIFLIKYIVFLYSNYAIPKYSFDFQKSLRIKIFQNLFKKNNNLNSQDLIQSTTNTLQILIIFCLIPGLKICSNLIVIIFIISFLIYYEPNTIFIILILSFFLFFSYQFFFKERFKNIGKENIIYNNTLIQYANEISKGLIELNIYNKSKFYLDKLAKIGALFSITETKVRFFSILPKLFLEVLIIFFFFSISFYYYYLDQVNELVINIGIFGFAALRVAPAFLEIIQSLNSLKFSEKSINDVYQLLKNDIVTKESKKLIIPKFNNLNLSKIKFKYPDSKKNLFNNLNLKINRGDFVQIKGDSGTGKTTLMKIILGLEKIEGGKISFNSMDKDKSFKYLKSISAYIPQENFILQGTLRENITFSNDKINDKKIWDLLKSVGLSEKVKTLPGKLNYICKENGKNFSGGQRQRISISRALFHNRSILLFDESTSALDHSNESKILQFLKKQHQLTKIFISHRPNLGLYTNKVIKL